jgi:hypothetical protein
MGHSTVAYSHRPQCAYLLMTVIAATIRITAVISPVAAIVPRLIAVSCPFIVAGQQNPIRGPKNDPG